MKLRYCLNARQTREYLKKADDIFVEWRDKDYIYELVKDYPQARIILSIGEDVDWKSIKQYDTISRAGFMLCINKEDQIFAAKASGIPFFYQALILDPQILNALVDFGVSAVRISGMLCHCLDYLETLPVEIRVCANNNGSVFNYKPECGSWFRPEDLYKLEAIDVCEFQARDNRDEQVLYRIYAEKHEWPGDLNLIIKDQAYGKEVINRMIPPEFQERRSKCRARCQYGGHCHYCETILKLANRNSLKYLTKENKE